MRDPKDCNHFRTERISGGYKKCIHCNTRIKLSKSEIMADDVG